MDPLSPVEKKVQAYGYGICAAIFLSYLLVYFHRVSPSVLALDMQRSLGVEGALLGTLGSAYFYAYAAMQIPVGILADSWGARKTVSSLLLVSAVGAALMGLSRGVAGAIVGRLLIGVGVSAVFVCNFKLLSEWFHPKRMATLGGLFMAVGGIGVFTASVPLAAASDRLGWRATMIGVGALSLLMAGTVFLVVRNRPSDKGWPDLRGAPVQAPVGAASAHAAAVRAASPLAGLPQVLGAARFWALSLWAGLCNGVGFALGSMWSVPFLQHVYGLSKGEASRYQSMAGLALLVGSPALGVLSNRLGRRAVIVGSSVLLAAVLLVLVAATGSIPLWAMYPLLFLLFVAGNAIGPTSAVVAKELFPPSMAGTSVGLMNGFPFIFGGVYQVLMGAILDRSGTAAGAYTQTGYRRVFLFALASAVLSLAAGLMVPETLHGRGLSKGRRPEA